MASGEFSPKKIDPAFFICFAKVELFLVLISRCSGAISLTTLTTSLKFLQTIIALLLSIAFFAICFLGKTYKIYKCYF